MKPYSFQFVIHNQPTIEIIIKSKRIEVMNKVNVKYNQAKEIQGY
jgi:hypothetical protein